MKSTTRRLAAGFLAFVLTLGASSPAWACAVCFGNPESPLTQGAQRGILTMLIITYTVLIGLVVTVGFMIVRARRR